MSLALLVELARPTSSRNSNNSNNSNCEEFLYKYCAILAAMAACIAESTTTSTIN